MVYKSLRCWMVFHRIMERYNRRNGCALTQADFYTLLATCYVCQKKTGGATLNEILELLKINQHTYGTNYLKDYLTKLSGYGFIERKGAYPAKYCITIAGINCLTDLETFLRRARIDK